MHNLHLTNPPPPLHPLRFSIILQIQKNRVKDLKKRAAAGDIAVLLSDEALEARAKAPVSSRQICAYRLQEIKDAETRASPTGKPAPAKFPYRTPASLQGQKTLTTWRFAKALQTVSQIPSLSRFSCTCALGLNSPLQYPEKERASLISSFFRAPLSERIKRLLADKSLEVSLSAWIQHQLNALLTFGHMQRKISDKDEDEKAWEARYTAIEKEDEDKAAKVKADKDAKKAAKKTAG